MHPPLTLATQAIDSPTAALTAGTKNFAVIVAGDALTVALAIIWFNFVDGVIDCLSFKSPLTNKWSVQVLLDQLVWERVVA